MPKSCESPAFVDYGQHPTESITGTILLIQGRTFCCVDAVEYLNHALWFLDIAAGFRKTQKPPVEGALRETLRKSDNAESVSNSLA